MRREEWIIDRTVNVLDHCKPFCCSVNGWLDVLQIPSAMSISFFEWKSVMIVDGGRRLDDGRDLVGDLFRLLHFLFFFHLFVIVIAMKLGERYSFLFGGRGKASTHLFFSMMGLLSFHNLRRVRAGEETKERDEGRRWMNTDTDDLLIESCCILLLWLSLA